MESELLLLAVLLAIHVGEGLRLLPRSAWFFRRTVFGQWRALPAFEMPLLKNLHLSFGAFFPSQLAFRTQAPPFLPTPEGLMVPHPGLPGPPGEGQENLHSWDELLALKHHENQLRLGENRLAWTMDEAVALRWQNHLKALAQAPVPQRMERVIQELRSSLDHRIAARRWRRFQHLSPPLHVLAWVQFGLVFMLFPALLLSGWILVYWRALLVLLVLNQATLLYLFRDIRSRVHPDGSGGSKALCASMFLSPPYLVRAPEMLCLALFEDLHPLAVAYAVMKRPAFQKHAETFLRALHHPLSLEVSGPDSVSDSALATGLQWQRSEIEAWLKTRGIQIPPLLAAPTTPDIQAYCPRCKAEYLREGQCLDCRGVRLIPIQRKPRSRK